MALKDWKRVKTYNKDLVARWIRKKSRYPRRDEDVSVTKYPDSYDVWHSTNPVSEHKLIYMGNSKATAISKAKDYMRKN